KIEILLKESEQKFRTIFKSSSIGIAITKIDGTLLETNESFIKIFNFPNKEKILKSNASYFYANKEEREEIVKLFNKNKPLTDYEVKLKKFDGSLFYASMNWIPIIINDEEFYLSIVSDISERKNFQINLQNAYNKLKEFEYIINRSDIIVVLCRIDDFFSVKYVSDNVKNLGYSPEEFYSVKEKTTTVISAEDFTRIKNEVENYLKNGIDEFILMFRVIKKNGEICFFEDKANIIKDDNGNKSYIQGVLIDITEKVKIEKEMQKQQMQVFQNIKMASLGQVVAGVAHEINNPNCLIMLNVTLLEDYWKHLKPIFDEYQKLQQNIETKKTDKIINNIKSIISELNTGSNRIKTIVDNLKDFSREGVESCKEYYSIKEIIEKAYLICGGAVRKRVSHIEFDIPDNLPMLYCNSVKIEQVFINLMTNAADAIIDSIIGRIKISCNLSGSEHIEFHIIDNGKGISRKNIDKIFEPFYTTKFNSGGTGLGLSIAWGIIKEHNGEIFVNSKEGEGTEFIIKLPVKKV
ncbi:PAS domain S-box protein, partial [Candidatus Dependentiae bacterium]|nr:PAS domain S-box protein [Candidatus Dependentiae bacterium]